MPSLLFDLKANDGLIAFLPECYARTDSCPAKHSMLAHMPATSVVGTGADPRLMRM